LPWCKNCTSLVGSGYSCNRIVTFFPVCCSFPRLVRVFSILLQIVAICYGFFGFLVLFIYDHVNNRYLFLKLYNIFCHLNQNSMSIKHSYLIKFWENLQTRIYTTEVIKIIKPTWKIKHTLNFINFWYHLQIIDIQFILTC